MQFGFSFHSLAHRTLSIVVMVILVIPVAGCSGCGNSPQDKLANFNLNRTDPEEDEPITSPVPRSVTPPETTPPVEEPAPTPNAKQPPAAAPKPEGTPQPPSASDPMPPGESPTVVAGGSDPSDADTSEVTIPGAAERYAVLEAMRLQPISGDRSETKARSQAILNVLGQAIGQRIADTSAVFATSPTDSRGVQLLSWRVHLLPYLGYDELYNKFKLDEPWDSPHNIQLASERPYAFATPGLADDHTSFVLLTGPTCAANERRAMPIVSLSTRGLHNSVVVVEVADPAARVVWTKPEDLPLDPSQPDRAISGWPDNQFLAVTADGVVHDLPLLTNDRLNQLFRVTKALDLGSFIATAEKPVPKAVVPAEEPSTETALASVELPVNELITEEADSDKRPLPRLSEIDDATNELKRLFQSEARKADSDAKRSEFTTKLLEHAEYLKNDPKQHCACLLIAYRYAVMAKDPLSLKTAFDKLRENYQVDGLSSDLYILQFAVDNIRRIPAHRLPEFREMARSVLDQARAENNFAAIFELIEIGTYFASSQNDQTTVEELADLKTQTSVARKNFEAIQARFLSLEVPSLDEEGNLMVGKYWCVFRDDWEQGFRFFLRSNDERFEFLAEAELSHPANPQMMFRIAEQWWELGIEAPAGPERKKFLGRAAQWYQEADQGMSESLEKVTAQQRLAEFTRLTGVKKIPPR